MLVTSPHQFTFSTGIRFVKFINPHQPTYAQTLEVHHFRPAMPDSHGYHSVIPHIRSPQANFSGPSSFADSRLFSTGTCGLSIVGLREFLNGTEVRRPALRRLLMMITGPRRGPVIIINNHCPWRTDTLVLLCRSLLPS